MMNNDTATIVTAGTVTINTQEHSYGIFCFNSQGDLFVNSDWGFFAFSWRSFGASFRDFLAGTNADYIVGKLGINWRNDTGKMIPKHKAEHLTGLVAVFIARLKIQQIADTAQIDPEKKRMESLENALQWRQDCREWLMGIDPDKITVSGCLEVLGYGNNGIGG